MSTDINYETYDGSSSVAPPRYALIFRTHFWDEFAQRQLERIQKRASAADVYVLVDETRGKVLGIRAEKVFSVTDDQILSAGFVAAGGGSIQWYSGDVPLYLFYKEYPDYDYYIWVEYDVGVHADLDILVTKLASDKVDVLGLTNKDAIDKWPWLSTCLDAYPESDVRHLLICFSAFSRNGLDTLYNARLKQAALYHAGELANWPFCEGFIASEALQQRLKVAELSDYGNVEAYDSFPPFIESDLTHLGQHTFIHPLLERNRYVASLFKRSVGLRSLLIPSSWLHRKLWRLGIAGYVKALTSTRFTNEIRSAAYGLVRPRR